jgi:hypothetical protein
MTAYDDYKKFVTNEPEAIIEFRTIEIYHPDLSQTYRYVSSALPKSFTLETGAPRDASALVEFEAAGIRITEPSERDDLDQILSVSFGNTDNRIQDIVNQITGTAYFTPTEIVYRKYISSNTSEPALPPLYMYASSVSFNGPTSAEFTAEDANLSIKRSGAIYTSNDFPGLT